MTYREKIFISFASIFKYDCQDIVRVHTSAQYDILPLIAHENDLRSEFLKFKDLQKEN